MMVPFVFDSKLMISFTSDTTALSKSRVILFSALWAIYLTHINDVVFKSSKFIETSLISPRLFYNNFNLRLVLRDHVRGQDVCGVRPSSGAAMLESNGDAIKSGASGYSVLAAPEDGRTPPTSPPPSLRDYR
jgi:hypothetical protein